MRRAVKKIDYSIESLKAELVENGGDFDGRTKLRGIEGSVRLIVRIRRADKMYKWAVAILFNNQRIDGIDWEPIVRDHRGKSHDCKGWHRHIWNPTTADKLKECLPKFNPVTVHEFLVGALRLLKVQLKTGGVRAGAQMRLD